MIGLRLLLQAGQWFQAAMPRQDALNIISAWEAGTLPPMLRGQDQSNGGGWCVKSDTIICVHTIDLEPQPQQTRNPWMGKSGLN